MKNFGLIKDSYNTILSENIGREDVKSKTLFKNYIKQIKESEVLKTQFLIYKNIEDKVEESETKAIEFIKENISLMQKYTRDEILEANEKLASKLPSTLDINFIYPDAEIKTLHENISTLILTKKTPSTIDSIVETTLKIVRFINNNKEKAIHENLGIPNSLFINIAVDKFNEKYEILNESYKVAVKLILESDINERNDFFNKSIKTCLNLINNKLTDADITIKESLLAAKENLLSREFNDSTFINDISKILELSEDLK